MSVKSASAGGDEDEIPSVLLANKLAELEKIKAETSELPAYLRARDTDQTLKDDKRAGSKGKGKTRTSATPAWH